MTGSFLALSRIHAVYPASPIEDVLFISSPEFAKKASLGYSGLLADMMGWGAGLCALTMPWGWRRSKHREN